MRIPLTLVLIISLISSITAQENQLPDWKNGFLDIHFISTGKGNSTFIIAPDGTSLLVDAGDLGRDDARLAPAVPDNSKTPAQWIADYIHQYHPKGNKAELDYVLVTHYHNDHIGSFSKEAARHNKGGYALSGITEVGSLIPIRKLIDSGEDFRRIDKESNSYAQFVEYRKFIKYQEEVNGLKYEKFKVGSFSQFGLKYDSESYSDYTVKNLFSNGVIAAVSDSTIAIRKFKEGDFPPENDLSSGIRIRYGQFDFYTGGDIPGIGHTGSPDTESMESLAAPVIGNVD